MRLSHPVAQALVAVTGLLGLADAQAYFNTAPQCAADNFVSLGCFTALPATFFPFTLVDYSPAATTSNVYPGFSLTTNNYDNSLTPVNCARVCRGFGFKYTALQNNVCFCGTQVPFGTIGTPSLSACNLPCGGDSAQTCGGALAAQIYVDPTFAEASQVPSELGFNPPLALRYRFLGCYRVGTGPAINLLPFPSADTRFSGTTATADACFNLCAALGYPLVFAERTSAAATAFNCRCGTSFNGGSYRVRPETLTGAEAQDCATLCTAGTGVCEPSAILASGGPNKCCARTGSSYAPVYINPELQGCFTPQIPGFKDSPTDTTFECYDVPASLVGGPKTFSTLAIGASPTLNAVQAAASRPPTVSVTGALGPVTYYLNGCYTTALGSIVNALVSLEATTLDACATRCASGLISGLPPILPIFGMTGGNQCVCGLALLSTLGTVQPMGVCNARCPGNPTQACGGPLGAVVLYYAGNVDANRPGYVSYSNTYLATPRPTYTCLPTAPASVSVSTLLTTVTTVSVSVSATTVSVSGSVSTSFVTASFTTTFTTALSAFTETQTVSVASATRTETVTVTTPYLATITFTSVGTTVVSTELRNMTYTTVRTLIDPGATSTKTLIDAGATRTLIDPAATRTVLETITRDGTTIVRTVTPPSVTGRPFPTLRPPFPPYPWIPGVPAPDCYDKGCTLSLDFGLLRFPTVVAGQAPVCTVATREWIEGETTLLPRATGVVRPADVPSAGPGALRDDAAGSVREQGPGSGAPMAPAGGNALPPPANGAAPPAGGDGATPPPPPAAGGTAVPPPPPPPGGQSPPAVDVTASLVIGQELPDDEGVGAGVEIGADSGL